MKEKNDWKDKPAAHKYETKRRKTRLTPFKVTIIVLITCQPFWNRSFHLWLTTVTVMYGWNYLEKVSILCVICLKACSAVSICFSYFNIMYHHKISAQVQLKEICINTKHICWTKFKNVNKILNKLFRTSCYSKMGEKNLIWLVTVSSAIPIHYPALMAIKIHQSDNITLATETWNQQSNLLLFGMFMTYSTSYCHFDNLRIHGMYVSNTTCLIKYCH